MPRATDGKLQEFREFLERYEDCWYRRDGDALRRMYCSDGDASYFDNHAGCSSRELEDHVRKVSDFFASGGVVRLVNEDFAAWEADFAACITVTHRYSTQSRPGVRATYFLEKEQGEWRIRHVHCSFDPDEAE